MTSTYVPVDVPPERSKGVTISWADEAVEMKRKNNKIRFKGVYLYVTN